MGIKVDFSNAGGSFEILEAGIYPVVVTNIEIRDSKSSEFQYANVELVVNDGPRDGYKLWTMVSFNPKAAFKLKEFLIAVGVSKEDLTGEADIEIEDYVGAGLEVSVISENYNGKLVNRVKEYISLSSGKDKDSSGPKIR